MLQNQIQEHYSALEFSTLKSIKSNMSSHESVHSFLKFDTNRNLLENADAKSKDGDGTYSASIESSLFRHRLKQEIQ